MSSPIARGARPLAVSRNERSAHTPRPPLAAVATDLMACSISRPSASKLSMINMVERNIKSWTTAARISRSERRSSQIPRAAKDRCQSNSIYSTSKSDLDAIISDVSKATSPSPLLLHIAIRKVTNIWVSGLRFLLSAGPSPSILLWRL